MDAKLNSRFTPPLISCTRSLPLAVLHFTAKPWHRVAGDQRLFSLPMTNLKKRHLFLFIVAIAALAAGVWTLNRFTRTRLSSEYSSSSPGSPRASYSDWARGLEKIKENRGDTGNVAMIIPEELRHYDDRRWFLAAQVAEVKKLRLQPIQDFVDLAAMIRRGELVPLPAATETYILYGVGARVDGGAFTRYIADQNLELNDERGLRDAYVRLESDAEKLRKEISDLQAGGNFHSHPTPRPAVSLKNANSPDISEDELEIEIRSRQQELKSIEADQELINQYYGYASGSPPSPEGGSKLLRDYDSLQALAENFGGRSFNLDDSTDREALKVYLLSSLRPQALKVLEEIARRYRDNFDRPLPISSLVRPEQYQRALRRVNRYASSIDTPPHSTGLAFDIDYRFMSVAEQNFVMQELARMKQEGRIEVLRERGANYHVFAFLEGQRPSDNLITASLDEVGRPAKPTKETREVEKTPSPPANPKTKSRPARNTKPVAKPTNRRRGRR